MLNLRCDRLKCVFSTVGKKNEIGYEGGCGCCLFDGEAGGGGGGAELETEGFKHSKALKSLKTQNFIAE